MNSHSTGRRIRMPSCEGTPRAERQHMLHRFLLAAFLAPMSACTDEVLAEIGTSTPCDGPVWQSEHDLGDTRWTDAGGEAAESGGSVLVVWQERRENSLDDMRLGAVMLDAATGEELRTLTTPTGDYTTVWVRPVDGGFYVFAQATSSIEVYFVAHDSPRFVFVTSFEDWSSDVVTTSLGVLAFGADGVHAFDHFGTAGEVHTDDVQRVCSAGTVLRDGRVFAWCFDHSANRESFVTMNADGSEPVQLSTTRANDAGWSARLATGDAGIFYVDAGDGDVSVALLNDDGTQRVAAVPVPLKAREESSDAEIIGAGTCIATCSGLQIVAEGNTALLEVDTVLPSFTERFLVHTDGSSLTFERVGTHDTTTRSGLTPAQPGVLSVRTRFGWHVPVFDSLPPPTLIVERTCLRQPIDDVAVDD